MLCYGTFGFGYIVPATFLPAMARQLVPDPLVFGLTWPLFGLAAALSVAAAARWLPGWPRRRVWALAQGMMALGTALPLAAQALWALAASAVLVGGTFMVATMAGLQLAREQAPANPTPLLARMTVAFAAGQIAGPLLVRASAPAAGPAGMRSAWASARPQRCCCSRRRGSGAIRTLRLHSEASSNESSALRQPRLCAFRRQDCPNGSGRRQISTPRSRRRPTN